MRPPFPPHPTPLHPTFLSNPLSKPPAPPPAIPPSSSLAQLLSRRAAYSSACRTRNAAQLSPPLTTGLHIRNTTLPSSDGHAIPLRLYSPILPPPNTTAPADTVVSPGSTASPDTKTSDIIVLYIHGGGLLVGDLDSEDLTCRRVCVGVGVGVVSVAYRLAPDEGVWPVQGDDVWRVVKGVVEGEVDVELGIEAGERKVRDGAEKVKKRKVVIMGSSSGSQLAACASIRAVREGWEKKVVGVVLRCPVTCYGGSAVSGEGKEEDWLPPWARGMHQSRKAEFENALLRLEGMRQSHDAYAVPPAHRTSPLAYPIWASETDMRGLRHARHFVQVCDNDILRDDGLCYAEGLKRFGGVDVRVDVVEGWPHTFWLKAGEVEEMRGVRWVVDLGEGVGR